MVSYVVKWLSRDESIQLTETFKKRSIEIRGSVISREINVNEKSGLRAISKSVGYRVTLTAQKRLEQRLSLETIGASDLWYKIYHTHHKDAS